MGNSSEKKLEEQVADLEQRVKRLELISKPYPVHGKFEAWDGNPLG